MNDLIISKQSLPPATIDELQEWIIVNKECLNAHKAKIRAIQKMNMAIAAKEAAIQDGQYLGDILLDAEVRLGEMLEKIQPEPIIESSPDGTINKAPLRGRKPTLPPGITKKQSHEAQEIARNPEAVEKTKQEARAEGILPTSRDVLAKIKCSSPGRADKVILKGRRNAMQKLVHLYFNGVPCGWADPEYIPFFKFQGYTIVRGYTWPIL